MTSKVESPSLQMEKPHLQVDLVMYIYIYSINTLYTYINVYIHTLQPTRFVPGLRGEPMGDELLNSRWATASVLLVPKA